MKRFTAWAATAASMFDAAMGRLSRAMLGPAFALALAGSALVPAAADAAAISPVRPAAAQAAAPSIALELRMVDAINAQRVAYGLAPLAVDDTLVYVGRVRSQDLVDRNYFAHVAPDGTTAFSLLEQMGVPYYYAGENLAKNNAPGAAAVDYAVDGFMNSPSHRGNVLGDFAYIGVGTAFDDQGFTYFAVIFMS